PRIEASRGYPYHVGPMDNAAPTGPARLRVATPVFEGPLELLLALAERDDLDILQVPLADLTDAYLREIAALERPDPAEMAEFLWTAARLLLLKSIKLLPVTVSGRAWTTEEKIELLQSRLHRGPLDLVDLILESEDRLEAVVTFVALLELLRRGAVRVRQKEQFGAIVIEPRPA